MMTSRVPQGDTPFPKLIDLHSANRRSGRHEDFWNNGFDRFDEFSGYCNCLPRREHGAWHRGNTAQRAELETRKQQRKRCFLSLLSVLFFSLLSVSKVFQRSRPRASSPSQAAEQVLRSLQDDRGTSPYPPHRIPHVVRDQQRAVLIDRQPDRSTLRIAVRL